MMKKRWKILPTPQPHTEILKETLKINPALCSILAQRNVATYEAAKQFFRPQLSELHDPWLMKDMLKATIRIQQAFNDGEKILIYGDYDVDGTTSVASFYQFIRKIYPHVSFYIPHRYREGYGVSKTGIVYAKEHGYSLIVSLDCGIKSVELITYAKSLSIDFIICDHHLPDDILPPAVAILNPKQKDCIYPFKELCGCGVGFKLMQALSQELNIPESSYLQYLDLVATAIAADIVPVSGENRILAYYGLKKVNEDPCTGIKALLQLAGKQKEISINNLVFIVAPRINAAGRMDDARKAVQLFIEPDYNQALLFAEMLHSDNTDRREADNTITEEALHMIGTNENLKKRNTTVVYRDHWHKGVVGIVASRLIETYYRPTVVLTRNGDTISGSARSVPGFNLYEAIHACRHTLIGYGGHFAAAGLTLAETNLEAFTQHFEKVVSDTIRPDMLIPEIIIDAEISFSDINRTFYSIVQQMEPFGPENMRPVFITKNVAETGYSKIVKEAHVRFVLQHNGVTLTGIGYNLAHKFDLLVNHEPLDIVYTIDLNDWNGQQNLQLKVIDLARPGESIIANT